MNRFIFAAMLVGSLALAENGVDRKSFLCIFADPAVGDINQQVKAMVDETKKACGVTLVVFPFYLNSNYPKNAGGIKALAKKKCNASQGLRRFGVERASALVLTSKKGLARSMSDPPGSDEDMSAEFGFDPGDSVSQRVRQRGRFGGIAKKGETAVAILGPGYQDKKWMIAALGQTAMGLPPGAGAGYGIGEEFEGNAGGGSKPENGWKGKGCQFLAENSKPMPEKIFRHSPQQERYVALPKAGARLYDLQKDRPVFGDGRTIGSMGSSGDGPSSGGAGSDPSGGAGVGGTSGANASAGIGSGSSQGAGTTSVRGAGGDAGASSRRDVSGGLTASEDFFSNAQGHDGNPGEGRGGRGNRTSSRPGSGGSGAAASRSALPGGAVGSTNSTGRDSGAGAGASGSRAPASNRKGSAPAASALDDGFFNNKAPQEPAEAEWPRRSNSLPQRNRAGGIYDASGE